MRLILHIGSSKTGTTTIQQFFCRNQSVLLEQGVFYPVKGNHMAHHVLMPASFVQKEKYTLPNNRFYMGNSKRYWSSFQVFWTNVLNDIDKHKPHTVILSAETLFHDFSGISERPLADFLGQYFDDIQVVAYIRSPASDYKSRLAQQIRTALIPIYPQARSIRSVIEYYESQFPKAVNLYPFEKKQLVDGDVLKDFLTNNVPEVLHLIRTDTLQLKNTSLHPALLQRLQRVRLFVQPDKELPNIMTNALVVWFAGTYADYNRKQSQGGSMELKVDINDYLQSSAVDYKWLKETYNVSFSDLDYSKIKEKKNPYTELVFLEDICDFDTVDDKQIEKLHVPTNTIIRLLITARFILMTQVSGLYRAHCSYTWIGKMKRRLVRVVKF